mgnify:CR=1 FL=1
MNNEGKILGIIIAFDLDRNGNEFVIRGSLNFYGKPLIKITNDLLEKINIKNTLVYTNQKGIIFKNILGKNTKYIVRKNNYLYTSNSLLMDFDDSLKKARHIMIIDPKYPLLDDTLLTELLDKHLESISDLTYIKGIFNNAITIPNIFVIDKDFFIEIIRNEFHTKNIEIMVRIYPY